MNDEWFDQVRMPLQFIEGCPSSCGSTLSIYNLPLSFLRCALWRIRNMLIKLSLHTLQLICIALTHI